jgi:hypothetical protein
MSTMTHQLETIDGPMTVYEAQPDAAIRGVAIVLKESLGSPNTSPM